MMTPQGKGGILLGPISLLRMTIPYRGRTHEFWLGSDLATSTGSLGMHAECMAYSDDLLQHL